MLDEVVCSVISMSENKLQGEIQERDSFGKGVLRFFVSLI